MTDIGTAQHRFIRPLDILFLRDNQLFGSAGDASRSQMPPWPSVFSGAIRSRMLADHSASITALETGSLPAPLNAILGTPEQPGSFSLGEVTIASNITGELETYRPLPADVIVTGDEGNYHIHRLQPQALPAALISSAKATQLPILKSTSSAKPVSGLWLNTAGWHAYLQGQDLDARLHLLPASQLWRTETRLGIALDADKRSAAEGKLYTSDAIAMAENIGFMTTVYGSGDALPTDGLLRLGGDGRGAQLQVVENVTRAEPSWDAIQSTGRLRLILTSPGIFPSGDRLPGTDADGLLQAPGFTARIVSQIVPRYEVVSGWDLHAKAPKAALRCAPVGSVYWLEQFTGDISALQKLYKTGLWNLTADNANPQRQAEGFNRIAIANI